MPTKQKHHSRRQPSKGERLLKRILSALVFIGIVIGLYYLLDAVIIGRAGYGVPDLGRGHFPGCSPKYNSRPPTSGCHSQSSLVYQVFENPIDTDDINKQGSLQVHNLEHGAVIIQYRKSGIPSEDDRLHQDLADLVKRLKDKNKKYCRLIVAPYSFDFAAPSVKELGDIAGEMKLALTAWARIDMLAEYDEERIMKFIDTNINRGPENVSDCNA